MVVVGSTLIFKGGAEGFGLGGGDDACAKMGFKEPKIDKKDIKGSLEKVMKNIKTVASKYIKFDGKNTGIKEEYNETAKSIGGFDILKSEMEKLNKNKENQEYVMSFGFGTMFGLCHPYILDPSEKEKDVAVENLGIFNKKDDNGKVPIVLVLKGGSIILEILNKIQKSDEMKEADKEAKKLLSVGICAVKHFISLWKNIQKATADGGGGDDAGDEEEKPKKKKKAKAKKEEDAEDDE